MDDNQIITKIRRAVRSEMAKHNLSLRAVARAAKIDHKTLTAFLETTDNPGVVTTYNVVRAAGGDLSKVLGGTRRAPFSVSDLEAALLDVLPGMPSGSDEKRASYLAQTVSDVLALPPTQAATKASADSVGRAGTLKGGPPH